MQIPILEILRDTEPGLFLGDNEMSLIKEIEENGAEIFKCTKEVFEKVSKAKSNILLGKGPQFLEFETYRWREHCGPNYDNDIGYRTEEEFLEWQKRDPIKNILKKIDKKIVQNLREKIDKEIDEAFNFAEQSPFPDYKDHKLDFYSK